MTQGNTDNSQEPTYKSTTVPLDSTGFDGTGKHIRLGDSSPYHAITVDEEKGTVTFHGEHPTIQLCRDLVALERDRIVGFSPDELHNTPQAVIRDVVNTLDTLNVQVNDLVLPEDRDIVWPNGNLPDAYQSNAKEGGNN
jgi:hypothetical protein